MNRVFSVIEDCPWLRIKSFVQRHSDVFAPNSKTRFVVGILDEQDEISKIVTVDFDVPEQRNRLRIHSETSLNQIPVNLSLCPHIETGVVSAPGLMRTVNIDGKQRFYRIQDSDNTGNLHEEVQFDQVLDTTTVEVDGLIEMYWAVLHHIVDGNDDVIENKMQEIIYMKKPEMFN